MKKTFCVLTWKQNNILASFYIFCYPLAVFLLEQTKTKASSNGAFDFSFGLKNCIW